MMQKGINSYLDSPFFFYFKHGHIPFIAANDSMEPMAHKKYRLFSDDYAMGKQSTLFHFYGWMGMGDRGINLIGSGFSPN